MIFAAWPYSTATWRNLRAAKLAADPMCEVCRTRGRLIPASHVDHVQAIAAGGPPFPALDRLMAMCASCHSIKTDALDRAGGKGVAFKGCDADGLPLDPAHPFLTGNTPSRDARLSDQGPAWDSRKQLVEREPDEWV